MKVDSASVAPSPKRRGRRWLIALITLIVLFAIGSLLVRWLLQPEQLTPILLHQAGKALNLEITATELADVRLRGQPQLILRGIVAREHGAKTPIFKTDRMLLSLPWSTLRSRGKDLTIRRVELDAPVLDVPALQAWLAQRPPSETSNIPTLTAGLAITNGRIDNDDWAIDKISVQLPSLHPAQALQAQIRGRYLDAPTAIPFDLAVALTKPANNAGLAVLGTFTLERSGWRMPGFAKLSGPLQIGQDDLHITPATFGMSARYESGDTTLPFALGLHGPLHFDDATWVLAPVGLALRGDGPIPTLDAHGALALGRRLVLDLDGAMPAWPQAWPALPAPIGASHAPLPIRVRYTGKPDLSEIVALGFQRDAMRFDSRFRLDAITAWLAKSGGSPLPPLDGHLTAPQLDISGAKLEGVEIDINDADIPDQIVPR